MSIPLNNPKIITHICKCRFFSLTFSHKCTMNGEKNRDLFDMTVCPIVCHANNRITMTFKKEQRLL